MNPRISSDFDVVAALKHRGPYKFERVRQQFRASSANSTWSFGAAYDLWCDEESYFVH